MSLAKTPEGIQRQAAASTANWLKFRLRGGQIGAASTIDAASPEVRAHFTEAEMAQVAKMKEAHEELVRLLDARQVDKKPRPTKFSRQR